MKAAGDCGVSYGVRRLQWKIDISRLLCWRLMKACADMKGAGSWLFCEIGI